MKDALFAVLVMLALGIYVGRNWLMSDRYFEAVMGGASCASNDVIFAETR